MTAVDATSALVAHPDSSTIRLATAVRGFLVGFKPLTRKSYGDSLNQWLRWCRNVGLDPLEVDRAHIELFGRHLEEERRLLPATVSHRLVTLRSFYRYCEDERIIERSPAARVRLPRVSSESSTHGMTRAEAVQFLVASQRNPTQHALCCLIWLNGLRVSEVCAADLADLGVEAGHRTLTVTRKGGKRQTIPLAPKTARAIDLAAGERTSGPLLVNKDGVRLSRFAARDAVARIGRRAALPYPVHPHMGRHCFVTMALEAGAPLHDVQDSAGHADPRTTMRYNRRRGQLDRNSTHLVTAFLAAG